METQSAGAPAAARKHKGYLSLLKIPSFALLWSSQAFSEFGSSFTRMALLLLAPELARPVSLGGGGPGLGGTVAAVSLLMACQMIPSLLLGPFGGPLVDRSDRRRLMVAADVARCLVVACLAFRSPLWVVLGLVIAHSALTVLFNPARSSIIPDIVPKEDLMTATSLWQATSQGVAMLGPAVAGMVIVWVGLEGAFLFDAFTFLASAMMLRSLRIPCRPREARSLSAARYLADLRHGLAYAWKERTVRYFATGLVVVALVGAVFNVSAVTYYLDSLRLSDQQFGWVSACNGIGALAAAALVGKAEWARRKDRLFVTSMGCLGGTLILYLARPGFWPLLPLTAVVNGLSVSIVVPAQAALYETVDLEARGRVFALIGSAMAAAPLMGYLVAGFLGGIVPNVVMAGCGAALLMSAPVMILRSPARTRRSATIAG